MVVQTLHSSRKEVPEARKMPTDEAKVPVQTLHSFAQEAGVADKTQDGLQVTEPGPSLFYAGKGDSHRADEPQDQREERKSTTSERKGLNRVPSIPRYSLFDYPPEKQSRIKERFLSLVEKTDNCWLWLGRQTQGTRFLMGGLRIGPHRLAFEIFKGPVPEGKTIDHVVCHNRKCVNPEHLQAMSAEGNNHRERSKTAAKPKMNPAERLQRLEAELMALKELMGSSNE